MQLYTKIEVIVPLEDEQEACNIVLTKLIEVKESLKKKTKRVTRKTSKMCFVDGCRGHAESRGLCSSHYNIWYKAQPKMNDGTLDTERCDTPRSFYHRD